MFMTLENKIEEFKYIIAAVLLLSLVLGIAFYSNAAHAQMNNESWGFKQQNRASIAALMQQVESRDQATVASSGGFEQLVCGGDGQSSATGNSTCIIMSNSSGAIEIGQDAAGNQDANNTENTTVDELSDTLESMEP